MRIVKLSLVAYVCPTDRSDKSRLAVRNMADCADVDMGFVALEDLFGHIFRLFSS